MAVFAQYIAVLGGVEDDIVECFRTGGGVPYARFPRFHEVMAEDSGQSVLSSLESHILPLVPGLTDRLAQGIRVLDAGCGRGRILNRLAALYPGSRFVGHGSVRRTRSRTRETRRHAQAATTSSSSPLDLSDFDETAEPEAFDFITTFDAIHDQAKPLNVLKGIHRALKPDGVYLMQDISGIEPRAQGHRASDRHVPVHGLLHALHDGVAGAGRRRSGRDVGRGEDARVSRSGPAFDRLRRTGWRTTSRTTGTW